MKNYNEFKKNFPITKRVDVKKLSDLIKKQVNTNEKIIIRESMWELVLRFYYQYDKNDIKSIYSQSLYFIFAWNFVCCRYFGSDLDRDTW